MRNCTRIKDLYKIEMDYNKIGNEVIDLVKTVGDFIKEQGQVFDKKRIESKGLHDFVSFVDKQAEQKLVDGLSRILPNAGFIVEENTAGNKQEDYIWIVDPLDGTTNFIHGVSPHAISVALQYKGKTILGVVYELGLGEAFYSWEGIEAFCNGQIIKVSEAANISEALIAAGMPVNDYSRLKQHLLVVEQVVLNSHGLRRHGSAATDLAYVAAGRFCGFFEYGLSPWDVAAGAYLVQKAGGIVSDYKKGQDYLFGREMLAANPKVHSDLLALLAEHM